MLSYFHFPYNKINNYTLCIITYNHIPNPNYSLQAKRKRYFRYAHYKMTWIELIFISNMNFATIHFLIIFFFSILLSVRNRLQITIHNEIIWCTGSTCKHACIMAKCSLNQFLFCVVCSLFLYWIGIEGVSRAIDKRTTRRKYKEREE